MGGFEDGGGGKAGSMNAGKRVAEILKGKKGSIKNAPPSQGFTDMGKHHEQNMGGDREDGKSR